MKDSSEVNIIVNSPLMTQKKFSSEVGLRERQTESQVAEGNLPTVKIGKHRMINMVALTQLCAASAAE